LNTEEQALRSKRLRRNSKRPVQNVRRRQTLTLIWLLAAVTIAVIFLGAWVGSRALIIRENLGSAKDALVSLEKQLADGTVSSTPSLLDQLQKSSDAAKNAASDPLWKLAGSLPWVGANFSAITEVAISMDDVTDRAVVPLLSDPELLNFDALVPAHGAVQVDWLEHGAPKLISAAHVIQLSHDRISDIDSSSLLPEVGVPLSEARDQLAEVSKNLDAAANAARVAPSMLGADGQRRYLLLIQNNAESRATGGIPGALAVLTLDKGKLTLGEQTNAGALGSFTPPIASSAEQQQIYSARLGKYMQDVNLTPDFPTAASTAQAMWENKTGEHLDGVLSIDPVALGYLLDATGPVQLTNPELRRAASTVLPTELSGKNVVQTLLSDVYARIEEPRLQDAYFAGVAQEVFTGLSEGKGDPTAVIQGIAKATVEGRILLWSGFADEQVIIAKYPLSGSIAGPSISPAQFGVYFNDGTGAKMDYYLKRTVQLVEECTTGDYGQVKVRITSTNTAPADAATSLPAYVTGDGVFGIPPGTVQTNVIAYGPVQANIETALVDGKKTDFAAHRHSNRPVGAVTITLAPGQTSTVELTFGKIVQHTEPNLVVTPTVQPVKDVVLGTKPSECVPMK
jgi:hypothetical protein